MPKNLAEVQVELTRISNRAKELVGQALRRGTISRVEHDRYVRELSETGNVTRVLVELELEDADSIRNRADLARQVEQALAGLARQAGARVVAGSTRVTLDAIDPANEDGYQETDFDETETDEVYTNVAGDAGVLVQINARVANDSNALTLGDRTTIRRRVEGALGELGRGYGINMVPGSTVVNLMGRDVQIQHRATGEVHLVSQGAEQVADTLSRLASEIGVELVRGSVRVAV